VVVVVPAGSADAQLGGLLKKKAKEVAQSPVKKEETKPPSDEAAARALSQPDVVPITQDSTDRFKKGLNVEITLRDEFRTFLASLKTREQYDTCKGESVMSPEGQKIGMQMLNLPDNASPAEMQKVMMKSGADLEALTTKRCGRDPAEWDDARRAERLREIRGQASDAAMPPGYVAPAGDASGESAGASPDAAEGLANHGILLAGPSMFSLFEPPAMPHPFQIAYAMMTERWPVFCEWLTAKTKKTDEGSYQKVPGVGNGTYVYSKAEAEVMSANCPSVMELLMKVLDPVDPKRR